MSASIKADIAKLEVQIARDVMRDRVGRATDASMYLRKAMGILERELRPSNELTRTAELLCEAADLLDAVMAKAGYT